MICFYPGPSKLYPSVKHHLMNAYDSGLLERNHRSLPFEELMANTISLLKSKLNIPDDYVINFCSSATESWEIIAQSFTQYESTHLYNGAFGRKWLEYASKIKPKSNGFSFELNETIETSFDLIKDVPELICITQNETSNGTQVSNKQISQLKNNFQN